MRLVDLTLPITECPPHDQEVTRSERKLRFGESFYTAVEYTFRHTSMVGTYIDFPGHIRETDDGTDADTYPIDKLVDVKAAVIHLDRESGSGEVSAFELQAASPVPAGCGALILNALGSRRFDDIENRTVWLGLDAGEWIINTGVHLLVSDIYERTPELTGIFNDLFEAGISTVCWPINLHMLTTPYVRLTVLPLRFAGVTQLPCRVVARLDES